MQAINEYKLAITASRLFTDSKLLSFIIKNTDALGKCTYFKLNRLAQVAAERCEKWFKIVTH